mmetsp:Transcript_20939/g.32863  ORF Transcript_20939/g.32863 Transcript_20939/m.32863 type:complete len:676 (+) Transcript_20939:582-2609(+)
MPDRLLLSFADAGCALPSGALLPRRGEHQAAGVLPGDLPDPGATEQLHGVPHRPHLPRLGPHAAGAVPARLRVHGPGAVGPGPALPPGLLVRPGHADAGPGRPHAPAALPVPPGHLLPGRGGAQRHRRLGARRHGRRHRPPDLHGGDLLPGGVLRPPGQRALLCGPLLPAGHRLPCGDPGGHRGLLDGADQPRAVLPGDLLPAGRHGVLLALPRRLHLPGVRHVRALDLRRGHLPLAGGQRHLPAVPHGHLPAGHGRHGHQHVRALPGRPGVWPARDELPGGLAGLPGGLHLRRGHGPHGPVHAQVPRGLLLRHREHGGSGHGQHLRAGVLLLARDPGLPGPPEQVRAGVLLPPGLVHGQRPRVQVPAADRQRERRRPDGGLLHRGGGRVRQEGRGPLRRRPGHELLPPAHLHPAGRVGDGGVLRLGGRGGRHGRGGRGDQGPAREPHGQRGHLGQRHRANVPHLPHLRPRRGPPGGHGDRAELPRVLPAHLPLPRLHGLGRGPAQMPELRPEQQHRRRPALRRRHGGGAGQLRVPHPGHLPRARLRLRAERHRGGLLHPGAGEAGLPAAVRGGRGLGRHLPGRRGVRGVQRGVRRGAGVQRGPAGRVHGRGLHLQVREPAHGGLHVQPLRDGRGAGGGGQQRGQVQRRRPVRPPLRLLRGDQRADGLKHRRQQP